MPYVVNRSAVMDLHRFRSCATLIQSLYDIFVHSLMLLVHIVLGPPPPASSIIYLFFHQQSLYPVSSYYMSKILTFPFLIVFNNDLFVFILCKTSPLVLCSSHDILNILLYSHISKASNLSNVTLVSVHVIKNSIFRFVYILILQLQTMIGRSVKTTSPDKIHDS